MIKKIAIILVFAVLLFNGARAQTDWKVFNDTFKVYSVSYPPDFELRVIDYQNIFIVSPLDGKDDKFQERVKLELSAAPPGYSLDSIANLIQKQMKMSMKGQVLLDPKIEDVKLGGQPAKKISGSGVIQGDETLINIAVTVSLVKNAMLRVSSLEAFEYKLKVLGFSGIREHALTPLEKVVESVKFK